MVLVDEPNGWVAFFCTDSAATVADRFSLETCFRDLKQSVAAGQQQVRGVERGVLPPEVGPIVWTKIGRTAKWVGP